MTAENTVTENQHQPSLGQILKAHREQANISLESLKEPLKLSMAQLQHLENDELHLLGPATFVKGYIKNYCRELNIDSAPVLALLPAAPVPQKPARMQSFSRRTEKEANDSRLMLVSYLILAIVLGSSAVWWWQNSTPIEEQTNTINAQNKLPEGTAQKVSAQASAEQPSSEKPIHAAQNVSPNVVELTAATLSPPQTVAPQNNDSNAEANNTAEQNSTIVMHFSDDSWVEIHDAQGDKVAFGVKKAGYTMTVSGIAPFSVVLGKHTAVSITLNGEVVDISTFAPNRLAKFKLPLAE